MKKFNFKQTLLLLSIMGATQPAFANSPWQIEGDLTGIAQTSNQSQLEPGFESSGDLFITYQNNQWQGTLHLEGNTTPRQNSVTSQIADSNADAFSATDQYDNGRIQLSELFLSFKTTRSDILQQLDFGILDATALFDTHPIMNDENTQFIASSLVNNPTIDFPDYTLGVVATLNAGLKPNRQSFVGIYSGEGLADSASRDYNETLDVAPDKKGLFIIAETQIIDTSIHHLSTGAWIHTGPHTELDNPNNDDLKNYGIYLTASHQMQKNTIGMHLGYANPEVNDYNMAVSLSVEHTYNSQWTAGLGGTYQSASSHTQLKDRQTIEAYGRYQLNQSDVYLTPSVQYLTHTDIGKDVMTANIRLSYLF